MTRRRFYAPAAAFAAAEEFVTLGAEETRHLRDVLRLHAGDTIYVFDGAGREFCCAVKTINRNSTGLLVLAQVEPAGPESPLNLTLAIALLKGEKFDLVIQKATELGVTRMVPLSTERADVRLRDGDDVSKRATRWQRIALEAAKQAGRAHVPEVSTPISFKAMIAMEAVGKNKSPTNATRLMFSEREGGLLSEVTNSSVEQTGKLVALVGPEGGWTDEEIELARAGGWQIVTLGGRTLRAETAAIAVVALLQHRFGDLA